MPEDASGGVEQLLGEFAAQECAPVIEIDAQVTRLDVPDGPEMETAAKLVGLVLDERKAFIRAWHEQLADPTKATLVDFPAETVGVSPGSCLIAVGKRVIARFMVRFDEEKCGAVIEADWPQRKWDEPGLIGEEDASKHLVRWQQMSDRVDWACDELNLEGSSPDVEAMKRKLTSRYGMRFRFEEVT